MIKEEEVVKSDCVIFSRMNYPGEKSQRQSFYHIPNRPYGIHFELLGTGGGLAKNSKVSTET